jgi:tetratricopeptide (TPR) repeat protein/GTPase SAR1 family protein
VGILDRLDKLADQLGELIVPDDVRTHVELGAAYLDRGDLDSALYELRLATELRPDHARALYLLGLTLARRGDDDEAIDALGRAAAAKEGFGEAQLALGEVHRRRGHLEAAAAAYRDALDAGLADGQLRGEVYRGLGAVWLAERRLDKAVRELRKAVASLPGDAEALALLGRALLLRGDLDAARLTLERAVEAERPLPEALVSLAELEERRGRLADAERLFARAATLATDPKSPNGDIEIAARVGLARLHLATGRAREAYDELLRALALAPDRPDLLVVFGRANAAGGNVEQALAAFDRALVANAASAGPGAARLLFDRRPVVEEALRVALRAGMTARAAAYAAVLLEDRPTHPDALAAQALAALAGNHGQAGNPDRAAVLVAEATAAGQDSVELRLAAAAIAEAREPAPGARAEAAAALRRAAQLAPSDPRPRARLAELYRRGREGIPRALYGLLQLAHRHFTDTRELGELAPQAARLVATLDRPLLTVVMGEFNAGKSSFVNALLGEEVAPMGITPTTATINVLKYGPERKGRVVYLDGNVRDVAWRDVPSLLKGLGADEARRIRVIEVLAPLETLQRVNIVDTPGLNSIHPEHEETARRFIEEGDAVVWLFSVDQAAKATEGAALARIRGEGKKVLGVLNKIDRVDPSERGQILAHVEKTLGPHLETIVPFSARDVLLARRDTPVDEVRLAASNFALLMQTLEERFFSRARRIQEEAARARLAVLLDRARAIIAPLVKSERGLALEEAAAVVAAEAARFEGEVLRREKSQLFAATEEMAGQLAREVLDFVRPRSWPFGSNQASPADRDFLLGLIDERLTILLDASRARVEAELTRALDAIRSVEPEADFRLTLRLLDEEVYGRFRAFCRGFLRGGRVDDFFTRVLPKIELSERELRRALDRDAPWVNESAEEELRAPLRAFGHRFYAALAARLERARAQAELERFDVEERVVAPLETIAAILAETSPPPDEGTPRPS